MAEQRVNRFDRFSERAQRVLTLAQEEAQRFSHNDIGREHLSLGMLKEGQGIATGMLESLGVTTERLRAETLRVVGQLGRNDAEPSDTSGAVPNELHPLAILLERLRQAKGAAILAQQYEVATALRVQELAVQAEIEQSGTSQQPSDR